MQARTSISVEKTMTPTKTTNPAITATTSKLQRQQTTVLCPITCYPCEGDLSYLCEDYGCARKGGLSPRSAENL